MCSSSVLLSTHFEVELGAATSLCDCASLVTVAGWERKKETLTPSESPQGAEPLTTTVSHLEGGCACKARALSLTFGPDLGSTLVATVRNHWSIEAAVSLDPSLLEEEGLQWEKLKLGAENRISNRWGGLFLCSDLPYLCFSWSLVTGTKIFLLYTSTISSLGCITRSQKNPDQCSHPWVPLNLPSTLLLKLSIQFPLAIFKMTLKSTRWNSSSMAYGPSKIHLLIFQSKLHSLFPNIL